VIYALDLFGTSVFAVSGAMAAGRKRMDLFGLIVVATVTGLGGGTLRDVILGVRPVFWVADYNYIAVTTTTAMLTFVVGRVLQLHPTVLLVADAFGLAVFTAIGAQRAADCGAPAPIVMLMGVTTGVAGGMVRDVLCGEIPLVLRKEIYATASFLGALVFVFLSGLGFGRVPVLSVSIVAVLAVRLAAIRWGLSLPVYSLEGAARARSRPDDAA